jgi:hypothetical protein
VNYQRDLQVRLQERYRRLYKTGFKLYKNEVGFLVSFIRETPALRYLVENVERSEPDLDPATWIAEHFGSRRAEWPPSEEGRAKVAWHLLQEWADAEHGAAMFAHSLDPSDNNMDSGSRKATEAIVEPFIEFLQERIGEASDFLYLLERYVRRVEWFEQTHLWEAYQADTRHGEDVYDRDLRRFLFEQGIDYPFSQPRSASGLSDIVANLDSEDPLVCEVKLYDGESYTKAYLAKGVQQATNYAHDYGKTVAYLVIVNLSAKMLQLPSDGGPKQWPPRIEVGGVTVFLVHVRGLPEGSASTRGAADVVTITKDDLLRTTNDPDTRISS